MDISDLGNSLAAQSAKTWIKSLDTLVGIYIDPTGKIAVNGIRNGRVVYRTFSNYR